MRRRVERSDEGAYAILYGLLLVLMVSVAALVIDLGALRQNRRQARLASDSASVAGALSLDPFASTGAKPREACEKAWGYLATNLGFTVPATTGCGGFPTSYNPATTSCPTGTPPAVGSVGVYTVTVTWPVVDGSTLLTSPDANPAQTSTTTQSLDTDVDGTEPCQRIAVSVAQRQDASFASIFGVGTTTTQVSSVARAATAAGPGAPIAALNVLNRTACQTLQTSGQGFIRVASVTDPDPEIGTRPGIIAVESSGAGCGGGQRVIDVGPNAATYIRADGADGAGKGIILSWAMNAAPTGNPSFAYSAVGPTKLAPTPTVLAARSGSTPVTSVYGCASGCTAPYITNLRAAYGGSAMPTTGYAASPFPFNSGLFTRFSTCNVNSATILPPGNYYIDCDHGLSVKAPLVFTGGNVVSKTSIDISNSGCFAVNVPLTSAACPTVTSGEVTTKPLTESILYVQSGDITRTGGSFFAANTFTYLADGRLKFSGSGGGDTVLMTNPRLDVVPADCGDVCQDARFWKVALWSESSADEVIGGQGSLFLRGVLFTPNALFTYSGQSAQEQQGAQFWADKIQNSGQGNLIMAPNPSDSVPTPLLSVRLIR